MKIHEHLVKVDSVLANKEAKKKVNYDTLFISRPKSRLTINSCVNVSRAGINAKSSKNGIEGKSTLRTDPVRTISLGLIYRGLSAGLTLNPASMSGRNKDYEFSVVAYSNRYGLDVAYQSSMTLNGDLTVNGKDFSFGEGDIKSKMLTINGYYAFNGRRFSSPAAFSQTYFQRVSAGSWIVGFSLMENKHNIGEHLPEGVPDFSIRVGYFGIGGGYGYNFVIADNWLLHLSAIPSLVVSRHNNIKINGTEMVMETQFPDVILTERAALVSNFSKKFFYGATFLMNNSLLGDQNVDIDHGKWSLRIFCGYRL